MNLLAQLKDHFRPVLAPLAGSDEKLAELLAMIRPAQDAKFGDYQANFAMPLGKTLGKPPRDVASQIMGETQLADLCAPPEIAGPGFINLRLLDSKLAEILSAAVRDERLGVASASPPRTIVIDYSSPNVAKPMHVGHIRSTVIGDAIYRILGFLGHRVISDNHLGDWGTQFGMIIYGYKHFADAAAFDANPVAELSRLYKLVHQIAGYHLYQSQLPTVRDLLTQQQNAIAKLKSAPKSSDKEVIKQTARVLAKSIAQEQEFANDIASLEEKIAAVDSDPKLKTLADQHPDIDEAVLLETAKLHADDPENLRLWHEFLPHCRDEIARVYGRLDVRFDYEYGESFYHDLLAGVVDSLRQKGMAEESQGAVCVFVEGFDAPMIVQKKDGAYLYATTDLATIQYRMQEWRPDAILYVVDHRQSDHFDKLFAVARKWGYAGVELCHIKFGTVMGQDGKPYKTREGTAEGLESLLNEAVSRALVVVKENDHEGQLSAEEHRNVAEVVGIGGLKFADLLHNRTSDYEFNYDKMLLTNGYTATYMQYTYARCASIFRKGGFDRAALRASGAAIELAHPAERALALQLLRFSEALAEIEADYMPHHLTAYLFDLAKSYSSFFDQCPVLRADSERQRDSRLLLCDLTARTIRQGLALLGIQVVEQM